MTKTEFISQISSLVKPVRAELDLTQDAMAVMLGVSKKTLVEVEKGRNMLGWAQTVTLVCLFSDSHVLENSFGDDLISTVKALAFEGRPQAGSRYPKTMGGRVWWRNIEDNADFKIQQNLISSHYRLINNENRLICSSFDLETVRQAAAQHFKKV